MKSLSELNANPYRREWNEFTLERRYAVGSSGYRGSGTKVHLIVTDVIIEDRSATPGRRTNNEGKVRRVITTGDTFSAHSPCNGNGQLRATAYTDLDTDAITCKACLRAMGA